MLLIESSCYHAHAPDMPDTCFAALAACRPQQAATMPRTPPPVTCRRFRVISPPAAEILSLFLRYDMLQRRADAAAGARVPCPALSALPPPFFRASPFSALMLPSPDDSYAAYFRRWRSASPPPHYDYDI